MSGVVGGDVAKITSRTYAEELDRDDPLGPARAAFAGADDEPVYLDGNSLGRLPRATAARLRAVVEDEWSAGLVRSWQQWVDLPTRVGDELAATVLDAVPGEVVVGDSTTVNLYKLASAAVAARPGRRVIVTDDDNFPTDRYVLAGIAEDRGLELRLVHTDIDEGLDPAALDAALDGDVALVSLSHVAYRSGALLDLPAVTERVHQAGALVLWDLCHSAGAVPVPLRAAGADLAVGCTYKYLNAGPGAPAFSYVRGDLLAELTSPIRGWFGQAEQFAMGPAYEPRVGIGRLLAGTPDVTGLAAVSEGTRLLGRLGVGALRRKGQALTQLAVELADAWLGADGARVASPRDPDRRGSHVCLTHPEAYRLTRALADVGVVADYRTPERLRIGPAPAYTRFVDVFDAMQRLRGLLREGTYERYDRTPGRVT